MCLYVNTKKKKPTKDFKVYKVLKLKKDKFVTPSMLTEVKEGDLVAKGKISKNLTHGDSINGGVIHAYTTRTEAKTHWQSSYHNYIIFELTVPAQDFVAWGSCNEVAVKKLTFPPGIFDKYIKNVKKAQVKNKILNLESSLKDLVTEISSLKAEINKL